MTILMPKKIAQIIIQQHITYIAANAVAMHIVVSLLLKQVDE